MGESVVVLHSYSFVDPLPRNEESLEDNSISEISQSVSLGRFMTEDLDWEKWSCFSHKKYVDEAEKFSQPGSVAQKKAFFEAYYNRIAISKKAEASSDLKQEPESVVVLLNTLETLTKNESDDETEVVLSSEGLVLSVEKDDEVERKSGVVLEQEEETVVHEEMEDKETNHSEDGELLKNSSCTAKEETLVHDEMEDKEDHTEDKELLKKSFSSVEEEETLVHDEMEDKENHTEDEELLKKSFSSVEEEEETLVHEEMEDKENHTEDELLKKNSSAVEEEERRYATKNSSIEKSEPMELVFTQNISERPETHSSMKRQEKEKPIRQRFSFFSCFMGNTKTQDQNTTRKKKPNKLFQCLCFKPKMVGETEEPTKTQRRNL